MIGSWPMFSNQTLELGLHGSKDAEIFEEQQNQVEFNFYYSPTTFVSRSRTEEHMQSPLSR